MKQIIVIGGGAAGLMAAIMASRNGAQVTVLEKQKKPGTKILRTGNGRCNFTNTGKSEGKYHGQDPDFARKVISEWTPRDTMTFFEEIGIFPYHNGDWIYPHSEQAHSVLEALLRECERLHVRFKNQEQVVSIRKKGRFFQVWTRNWHYTADAVIICCGTGASQKKEFQTGAFQLFPNLRYSPWHPSLCPLLADKKESLIWAGTRVHASASLFSEEKKIHEEYGQIQFTKEGISGIPVMNMASKAWESLRDKKKTEVRLDLVPEMEEETLAGWLELHPDSLGGLLPEKLTQLLKVSAKEKSAAEAAKYLKNFRIPVLGLGSMEQSQVLGGGFLTEQFDPKTLMYNKEPGLFAAGEVLDIDGECGGWNLQFAWASGALAGKYASEETSFKKQQNFRSSVHQK